MRAAVIAAALATACGAPPAARDDGLGTRHVTADDDVDAGVDAAPVVDASPGPTVARDTIAVLVPRSGPYAAIGDELLAAIELAPADGARRVVIDTAGDPARAAAAVDEAVAAGAVAILGPVGALESSAAIARAQAQRIPIAVLAPVDGAPGQAPGPPSVFHLLDSPEGEARAAARFALELGVGTVGVLAPGDDVGLAAAEAFANTAAALGLTVAARGTYAVDKRTLEADVKAFLGLDPATNPRLAAHLRRNGRRGWQTFSPDVPFALLYLPDRYDRAALVASFLPYLGVEVHSEDFPDLEALARKHGGRLPQVVQLLGSAAWNHPSLITRGGPAIEGALLLEPCPLALGDAAATEFVDAYRARTRRDPSPAAAAAHDAWRLVAQARGRAATAADPRAAFARALAGASLDDGACAPATIDGAGRVARTPAVLKVDAGALVVEPY
ncbi:MAG: penicillin-binding protein activator [Myxococcales bacterium]|nr:penicillin-binding protein activator [Myxococcales bacterium]